MFIHYDAGFSEENFLHLLFGYHTWEELRAIMPECWANGKAAVIFDAIFPKIPSRIYAVS